MSPVATAVAGHGLLFDESLLHSPGFAVLGVFVLLNTVMFLALSILKLLPKVYVSDWFTSRNRRAETRSIHPDGVATPEPAAPLVAAAAAGPADPAPSIEPTEPVAAPVRSTVGGGRHRVAVTPRSAKGRSARVGR
ncbi:MAG: hypothetical protein ACTHMS_01500 [Jatrophihabitans sp.]|uniref:hypothetical protein n=1 Tax=Jatrophihabitans sp. TaxID=1932789 RepID=UPI003F8109AE